MDKLTKFPAPCHEDAYKAQYAARTNDTSGTFCIMLRTFICLGHAALLLLCIACQKAPPAKSTPTPPVTLDSKRQEIRQDTKLEKIEVVEVTPPPKSGIFLRFSPPIGLKWELSISAAINAESLETPSTESQFQIIYSGVVKSKNNNITTIETNTSPFKVTMPSGETNFKKVTDEIQVDNMGQVITAPNEVLSGLLGIGLIPFPKGKITTGSRWKTQTVRMIPSLAEMEVEEEYELSDIKILSGKKYALIKGSAQSITNTLNADFNYLIDVSTGIIQSGNIKQIVQIKDGYGSITNQLKISVKITPLH